MPRIAVIQKEKCNPIACGNYLCARLCPVNREGIECIKPGPDKKALIDEKLCTGCGICPKRCPFGAISIINLPEQLDHPINRYGRNGFHLYNLPLPIFGKVVGIIGRNGMGKTTALKILSGQLVPNLGKESATYQELATYYRGSEAQAFLERIETGKVKMAYKPQQIDALPKTVGGTVKEALNNANEKDKTTLDIVTTALDLKHLLTNSVGTLSGGELQRLAIAATALKKADVYFFDEPTSYLDIKQRLNVTTFIRSLAATSAVIVVEHDLIVLDAIADLIHLVYGKQACYGVISLPKTAKEGINTYLDGYIRDENIRFREKSITFQTRSDRKPPTTNPLISWSNFSKKMGHFSLTAHAGALRKGEVVGVLGENGTGKTTFVKILAKVLTPDTGKVDTKTTVAYKPQYLEPTTLTVREALEKALKHDGLLRSFDLHELLDRRLTELSGGELQRVAIAHCLSQEAEVYLLDEPSAFLDIEQRLITAKIIRDFADSTGKTVLVVDHDLLFLDYVSDRLCIFSGTPGKEGIAQGPFTMAEGMNHFLTKLGITFRRDTECGRPRVNKKDSVMDREQKAENKMYYA